MAKQTVSIVGAGLSGLSLGRCLQRRGIKATLYDRNPSPPPNSYGISLYYEAYRHLLGALDASESAFRSRVAVDAAVSGTGNINNAAINYMNDKPGNTCFRANRGKLEEWLKEGLDIKWGHELKDAVCSSNGKHSLIFADGQTVQSDIIVGADGPHSSLRKALLPESKLEVHPVVVYNGKRRMRRSDYEAKILPNMQESTIINHRVDKPTTKAWLYFGLNEYKGDQVSVSWTYSRAAKGDKDVLYKPERTLSGAKEIPQELFEELETLHQSGLPQPFAELFEPSVVKNDRILHWLMRSVDVPAEEHLAFSKKGIITIGDAAHAEPIEGGMGANLAIEDAAGIAMLIASGDNPDLSTWIKYRHQQWKTDLSDVPALTRAMLTYPDLNTTTKSESL
ncbi:FAD/NAD(P)-binding domain-containing protein [Phaeosphaeriaceae sp. SRC1lsM3a]|nr:FAD/NAD(P)-binding domain-containing protein [Stagonospora sp. SRC1lsM3a]